MVSENIKVSPFDQKRPLYMKYRLTILYRFVLAIFGGYALAVVSSLLLSVVFSNIPASAVMSATMLAFIIHCGIFIWVFMVNSTIKASLGVIIPLIIFTIIYKIMKG